MEINYILLNFAKNGVERLSENGQFASAYQINSINISYISSFT